MIVQGLVSTDFIEKYVKRLKLIKIKWIFENLEKPDLKIFKLFLKNWIINAIFEVFVELYSWKAVLNLVFKTGGVYGKKIKRTYRQGKTFCNCFVCCGKCWRGVFITQALSEPKSERRRALCREDIADEIKRRLAKCRNVCFRDHTVGYKQKVLLSQNFGRRVVFIYMENWLATKCWHYGFVLPQK